MGRNKLLTIRIEEGKREAFNNWCEKRNYNYSKFLYEVINACLDGRIDESIVSSQSLDANLVDRINDRIDKLEQDLDSQSIDNNLVTQDVLQSTIASLREEFLGKSIA